MSYIIKSDNPFASTKLTEIGREKLAKGQLTFSDWAIGDSELNYTREELLDGASITGDSRILRPKDKQANLKYFISSGNDSPLNTFSTTEVRCIQAIVNNKAVKRGAFADDDTDKLNSTIDDDGGLTMKSYIRSQGTAAISAANLTLTADASINNETVEIGDFVLLKMTNTDFTNTSTSPNLWFKTTTSGSTVTVDRTLPSYTGNITYIAYKGGEPYNNEDETMAYWDPGTLSFTSDCDVSMVEPPIWNLNQPFSEGVLGVDDPAYEKLDNYGSYDYIGQKNNYLFDSPSDYKSVGIIHYTNKSISNQYGEFLYINDKTVTVTLGNIMYNRRDTDTLGMEFVSDTTVKTVGSSGLNYVDLIEDVSLVAATTAKVVGRIYYELKIIVFTDPEILATMSYKSNRNWTLPKMNLTPVNADAGNTGILGVGETIFVTYSLDNTSTDTDDTITPALPCQDYSEYTNTTSLAKDIQFFISDTDALRHMSDTIKTSGFYGNELKVMYQVTDGTRPVTDAWKVIDYTPTGSGTAPNGNILKTYLITQNPLIPDPIFQISEDLVTADYSIISTLGMAPITDPDILQFGDERIFYGNIDTNIGATIYKTLFKITINASDFNTTTNITRGENPSVIKVSEVGIYDATGDLVIISKLSKPIKLTPGNTVMIELSMDF